MAPWLPPLGGTKNACKTAAIFNQKGSLGATFELVAWLTSWVLFA
jgi:hypothetical protein